MSEVMQLGGNIELSGFSNVDGASMVILKKMIGNYGNYLSELSSGFEKLSIVLEHAREAEGDKFQVNATFINGGKQLDSEAVEKNLFVALDNSLKKIANQLR